MLYSTDPTRNSRDVGEVETASIVGCDIQGSNYLGAAGIFSVQLFLTGDSVCLLIINLIVKVAAYCRGTYGIYWSA